MYDKAIINGRVYLKQEIINTNIYIDGEKIVKISKEIFPAEDTVNVHNALVFPALIDPHVHFYLDLGFIHSRDDFLAGTIQAAYGGITTIIDFLDPVDNPMDLETAYYKRLEEAKNSVIDYTFHATIKNPQCDLEEFVLKMKELGITSLKLFTTYSDSGRRTYDEQIIELLKLSEKYKFLLMAHIENDDLININENYTYKDLSKSRPTRAETSEALKLAGYVKEYGGYLYMVHLSSGQTLTKLKENYPDILNRKFFVESCPQYFILTNDYFERDDGYLYTLAPPVRKREERKILKENIDDVFTIGTDHCAFLIDDKEKRLLKDIPLGIGGIEFSFDLMYDLFQDKVIDKMSYHPARLFKLEKRGEIKEGNYANLFVYELTDNLIDEFHGFTDYSVYKGMKRKGRVIHTLNRGKFVIRHLNLNNPNGKKI